MRACPLSSLSLALKESVSLFTWVITKMKLSSVSLRALGSCFTKIFYIEHLRFKLT